MSGRYTRNLIFKSNELGRNATLVLIFDTEVDYVEKFPVVWRSSEFVASGPSQTSATYFNQPAFLKPQLRSDLIESTAASQALDPQQQTTLLKDKIGRYSFTDPVPATVPPGNVVAVNGTDIDGDIALGFGQLNPSQPITPVVYWNSFPAQAELVTKLSPVLRGYITDQYDDAKIIREGITAPLVFEEDLSMLAEVTVWILTWNADTGRFEIQPELA